VVIHAPELTVTGVPELPLERWRRMLEARLA